MRILSSLLFLGFLASVRAQSTSSPVIATNAKLHKEANGYKFTEGPAVDPFGNVYFTDQPNNQILKWSPTTGITQFLADAGRSNGLYFDHQGRLLACADEKNELWRISTSGKVEILLKHLDGNKFNGPNDLWVHPSGGIYFTDPFYKRPWWDHEEKPIPSENVYLLKSGENQPILVVDDLVKPNGIIGSKNGKMLYVADIGDKKTYRFRISKDGTLQKKTLFCQMGSDGMTLDHKGNLYITGNGVTVFNKKGKQIERIEVPEKWTANVVFGGIDQKKLFITAMGAVYTLDMKVHGIR